MISCHWIHYTGYNNTLKQSAIFCPLADGSKHCHSQSDPDLKLLCPLGSRRNKSFYQQVMSQQNLAAFFVLISYWSIAGSVVDMEHNRMVQEEVGKYAGFLKIKQSNNTEMHVEFSWWFKHYSMKHSCKEKLYARIFNCLTMAIQECCKSFGLEIRALSHIDQKKNNLLNL